MADYPGSPSILKGALALYDMDASKAEPTIVAFQYNPDQVRRTLANWTEQQAEGPRGAAKQDLLRVAGPPIETISMSIVLDATDQLTDPYGNQLTAEYGLHPAMAALEMMMYPPSLAYQKLEDQASHGEVQVSPAHLPLTLLYWGKARVVPVAVTSFSVAEEAFDTRLNPIQVKADLGLRVLTYMEFPSDSIGRDAFLSYQKEKEWLAGEFNKARDFNRIRSYVPGRGG